jgi:hypothetical protein
MAAAVPPNVWQCPNCRRRVPRYVAVCHCGARRTDVDALAPAPAQGQRQQLRASLKGLPWDAWAWLCALLLFAGIAAAELFRARRPEPAIPLIGYVDRGVPKPTPHVRPKPVAHPR